MYDSPVSRWGWRAALVWARVSFGITGPTSRQAAHVPPAWQRMPVKGDGGGGVS
jgi:hypothetical protein